MNRLRIEYSVLIFLLFILFSCELSKKIEVRKADLTVSFNDTYNLPDEKLYPAFSRYSRNYNYIDKFGQEYSIDSLDIIGLPDYEITFLVDHGIVLIRSREGKIGFINRSLNFIVYPIFDNFGEFKEGFASVKIGDAWGYVDTLGNVIIQPQFRTAREFSEGFAQVTKFNDQIGYTGYINKTGKVVIPYKYLSTHDFSNGLALVKRSFNGNWLYIDKAGEIKIAIPGEDRYAQSFSEGFAPFLDNSDYGQLMGTVGYYGYIDTYLNVKIKPKYNRAGKFSEGLAPVKIGDSYFYIDKSGSVAIKPKPGVYYTGNFSEGLAVFTVSQMSSEGREVLKSGYIDKKGNVIIEPRSDLAEEFNGGVAKVWYNVWNTDKDYIGYIDKTGKEIWTEKN